MKKIIFYEKSTIGHREYIGNFIERYLHSSYYNFVLFNNNNEHENCLKVLIDLYKENKFDHCHLLTLDDCIFDFQDKRLIVEFKKLNISLSATLFHFDLLQFCNFLYYLKEKYSKNTLELPVLHRLLKNDIIKKIAIPDERVKNKMLYPVYNKKFVYLPDFTRFKINKIDRKVACDKLGLKSEAVNFLMFGEMTAYKGLYLLAEVINNKLLSAKEEINFIIAGKNIDKIKLNSNYSNINVIKYDEFVEEDLANILFSASDCVLLPFDRRFKISSGTYALACAHGKFIITAKGGALGWLVKKYKNGFVFKPENAKSFAQKIDQFIDRKKLLKYPIKGSLEYAKKCTITNYVTILNKIIFECIGV